MTQSHLAPFGPLRCAMVQHGHTAGCDAAGCSAAGMPCCSIKTSHKFWKRAPLITQARTQLSCRCDQMHKRTHHYVCAMALLCERHVELFPGFYTSVQRSSPHLPATHICLACTHLRCKYVLSPGCPGPAASAAAASRACLAASAACSRALMRAAAWAASLCWTARRSAACRHQSCVVGNKPWPLLGAKSGLLRPVPLPGPQESISIRSLVGSQVAW